MSGSPTHPALPERLHGLDALRGLAALAVVVFHVQGLYALSLPAPLGFIRSTFGLSVPLFFVLSAFSLYYADAHRMHGPGALRAYARRRLLRIAPLFYVMIAASVLLKWAYLHEPVPPTHILSSLTFTFNLIPSHADSVVWAGWSIGVEVVFYALLPLAFRWVRTLPAALALLALSACATLVANTALHHAAWAQPKYGMLSFLTNHIFFAAGIVAFFVWRRLRTAPALVRARAGWLALGLAVLTWWLAQAYGDHLWPDHTGVRPLTRYMAAVPFGLLVLAMALRPVALLCNRATVWTGQVSYSLYLLHMPIIVLLGPAMPTVQAWLAPLPITGTPADLTQLATATALVLAISLPLSWLTYRWIELPGMRLGRRGGDTQAASGASKAAALT